MTHIMRIDEMAAQNWSQAEGKYTSDTFNEENPIAWDDVVNTIKTYNPYFRSIQTKVDEMANMVFGWWDEVKANCTNDTDVEPLVKSLKDRLSAIVDLRCDNDGMCKEIVEYLIINCLDI